MEEKSLNTMEFTPQIFGKFHFIADQKIYKVFILNRYDEKDMMWKATTIGQPNFLATSKAPHKTLLLGPANWTVYNDSKSCSTEEFYTITLTLSACSMNQFTCTDGSCISMTVRCDGRSDCKDESDEEQCTYLIPSLGYNKFLVPPPLQGDELLVLNVSINILDIISIDENQGFFRTKFTLTRSWFDIHLTYQNLKKNKTNSLYTEDKSIIWRPNFELENIESLEKIKTTSENVEIIIIPNPKFDFTRADLTRERNSLLFKGSENAVSYIKPATVDWICHFEMAWYPFDSQVCQMVFTTTDQLTISPVNLNYSSLYNLPAHDVRSIKVCSTPSKEKIRIIIEVVFGRPLVGNILTVFLPTGMLVIISQLSKTFSQNYLDLVIEVNLTVLLVLTTM